MVTPVLSGGDIGYPVYLDLDCPQRKRKIISGFRWMIREKVREEKRREEKRREEKRREEKKNERVPLFRWVRDEEIGE